MWFLKLIPPRFFSSQLRKPSGLVGRFIMTKIFTTGNADLNNFVKECLQLEENNIVLEIGFGPGKLIYDIATLTKSGKVEGIDFSEAMLKEASRLNKEFIDSERVALHKGDCSSLPFEDNSFDKLCTVNTVYFWKNPILNLKEVYRVTKTGGNLILGFRDNQQMEGLDLRKDIFTTYSREEIANLLSEAGFNNVTIEEKEGTPFTSYCAVATKQ